MSNHGTAIQWTHIPGYKGETWNPVVGCSIASSGCKNCYAMAMARRICRMQPDSHYKGTVKTVNGKPVWTGEISAAPNHVWEKPLRWKKPRAIFVNSMGDLFHEDVPDGWIDKVLAIAALCPQHIFIILTKRSERMQEHLTRTAGEGKQDVRNHIAWKVVPQILWLLDVDCRLIDGPWQSRARQACTKWPLPNVWLGVSVENQEQTSRLEYLKETPAAVKLVSVEPMLSEVGLIPYLDWLDWVICGGESGPNARPMHVDWARKLRDDVHDYGNSFFMKQMSKKEPVPEDLQVRQWPTAHTIERDER